MTAASRGVLATARLSCFIQLNDMRFAFLRLLGGGDRYGQVDHLSGKPGNVREFETCQGNVRGKKSCHGKCPKTVHY